MNQHPNVLARPTSFVQSQLSPDQIYSIHNKKILLLYGPPGGGKSTMARVLAKHCKYESLEINASDERSGERLLEKIKNATQMNSCFKANQPDKPVCLIIDEVDGALGNGEKQDRSKGIGLVVEYLKKCINYTAKKAKSKEMEEDDLINEEQDTNDSSNAEEGKEETKKKVTKKKKDEGIRELTRPIIFICNDAYAKALRPLKEIALQIKVGSTHAERLLKRLRYICKMEGFSIDDKILRELC